MIPIAPAKVDGLPQGVDLVRIGVAQEDDYELVGGIIYRGPRLGAASGVIVQPSKGWTFRYDIKTLTYIPVQTIEPVHITYTVKFTVDNSLDRDNVLGLAERFRLMPGFTSIEQS